MNPKLERVLNMINSISLFVLILNSMIIIIYPRTKMSNDSDSIVYLAAIWTYSLIAYVGTRHALK